MFYKHTINISIVSRLIVLQNRESSKYLGFARKKRSHVTFLGCFFSIVGREGERGQGGGVASQL